MGVTTEVGRGSPPAACGLAGLFARLSRKRLVLAGYGRKLRQRRFRDGLEEMDLHTVNRVRRPAHAEEIASWEAGFAWLAGGTWLFSEPQADLHTLIDLESLQWPSLQASADGLEIASTCTVARARSVR